MPKENRRAALRPQTQGKQPVLFLCVCVVPTLLLSVLFMIVPTVRAVLLSFTDATAMSMDSKFVGWDNYTYMFHDAAFLQAFRNTVKLMLVVPAVTLFLSLIFAFLITQSKLREKEVYRVLLFFPSIISLTVVGIVWSFVFNPSMGILNDLLQKIGLSGWTRPWLGDEKTALWCVAATLVWQAAGYYMVMYIAGIDGISADVYEAATIDGAGQFRKLVSITLPLLKDIIGITFVLALSGTINQSFVLVTVMTNGGPAGASSVLLQYMYSQAFENSSFGYAMAIVVFTLMLSFVLSFLSRLITSRSERG